MQSPQDGLLNPAHQVYFRAGLIACREYMARFVEAQDPVIANSIRANWWPQLGKDYGPPRQLDFAEVTSGEYGTPVFRCKTAAEVSPTLEALPVALGFLTVREAAEGAVIAPSSSSDLAGRLRAVEALIGKWRDAAVWEDDNANTQSALTFDECADQLEAALRDPVLPVSTQEEQTTTNDVARSERLGEGPAPQHAPTNEKD